MIKALCLKGSFDPITKSHLNTARHLLKSGSYQKILFLVEKEGIASYKDRSAMVKLAIRPYRKMKLKEKGDYAEEEIRYMEISEADEKLAREGHFNKTSKSVNIYLTEHALYLDQIVDAWCNEKRAAHVRSMTALAKELAEIHHCDVKKAEQAGMLHDLCKNLDGESAKKIMEAFYPEYLFLSDKIWHQFTAEYVLKHIMGFWDKQMINAVRHHVMGDHSADLSRIIFIADKIDPGRGYNIDAQLSIAKRSLKDGAADVKSNQQKYLKGEKS